MYILILTLILKSGYAGLGGIAMQEFDSKNSCEAAAAMWIVNMTQQSRVDVYKGEAITLCVRK